MRGVLGAVATRIEHVGSTSVPGLAGKPIIDLLVGVPQQKNAFVTSLVERALAWALPSR